MNKILLDNEGQTCNVFWSYIRPLQLAILEGKRFIIPFYDKEIDSYNALRTCQYFRFPLYSSFLHSKLGSGLYTKILRRIVHNKLYNIIPVLKRRKHFVDGWALRHDIEDSCLDEVKELFRPNDNVIKDVQSAFAERRKQNLLIIGIHIRRGDYKTWHNGDYYYEFKEYANICRRVLKQFNCDASFFIASNESLNIGDFQNIPIFQVKGSVAHDLYALSCCDYIIGPPSSFSRWASFVGKVPIHFLLNKCEDELNFRVVKTYSKYENGEIIEFDF